MGKGAVDAVQEMGHEPHSPGLHVGIPTEPSRILQIAKMSTGPSGKDDEGHSKLLTSILQQYQVFVVLSPHMVWALRAEPVSAGCTSFPTWQPQERRGEGRHCLSGNSTMPASLPSSQIRCLPALSSGRGHHGL